MSQRQGEPYRVIKKLAAGGAGEVYLALETALNRKVALKYLSNDPESSVKLAQEARAAAAIDHPFIAKIYNYGELDGRPYLAMEYVEGETLQSRLQEGPLPLATGLQYALEICEALAEAHRRGVVHRDLKPGNIMLTPQRHVKVLDFGLAKRLFSDQDADATATGEKTSGMIVGTAPYMSPEQARGELVDIRTDLFSLGIVLFEMLAGDHPFQKETLYETVSSIINEPTPSLGVYLSNVPAALESLIQGLLEKDSSLRPASAVSVCQTLKGILAGAPDLSTTRLTSLSRSIAVLPFEDLSSDQDQQFFCDGLAEELINALTRLPDLTVPARTSAFRFRGTDKSLSEIGAALNVGSVLEGSVRKAGQQLRINVRMARTRDGHQLWSERFDGEINDVFAVEDKISDVVLKKLEVTYQATGQQERTAPAPSLEAYELYLRARHSLNQRTEAALEEAVQLFDEALKLEPGYALAHAGRANAFVLLGVYGAKHPEEVMPRARRAADRALKIDPSCSEAWVSRGSVRSLYEWNRSAQADFKRALELNPGSAVAHHWYANNFLLPRGRFDTARRALNQARRLDPLAPAIRLSWGLLAYLQGRYDEAVQDYSRLLKTDPGFGIAHFFRGLAYLEQGSRKESVAELEVAVEQCSRSSESLAALAIAQARLGKRKRAARILEELLDRSSDRFVSPVLLSQVEIALQRFDQALERLFEAVEIHATDLIWIQTKPTFAPIRTHPRFVKLAEAVGL